MRVIPIYEDKLMLYSRTIHGRIARTEGRPCGSHDTFCGIHYQCCRASWYVQPLPVCRLMLTTRFSDCEDCEEVLCVEWDCFRSCSLRNEQFFNILRN